MPGRITHTLGNLSVKLKLALGFGLVLLLTLAITWTGWHGLDTMIDRSESLSAIDRLNSLTKDLRTERIVARVANTPENVSRVVDRLNEIEALLASLRKH
ncbi:methyl-accepting chemotaxis protein, partial [Pseudomonas viridiflava]|uniref:methyl-accepting chemotaxis protein n=1 Tax=Pseudomonas viridiflava TaxID=33069 RepID=UPI0019D069D0